jgi:hypothetical protein
MALRADGFRPPEEETGSYIRGAGGVRVGERRVAGYLLAACVLVLALLTAVFTVIAIHHNSRATSLKRKGVPVQVTVTGCVALASGTGITQAGFTCRGSYTFAGHHYNENIGGSAQLLAAGQKVSGVAVRDEPAVLYTASSAQTMHSTWTVYVTPAVLLLLLVGTEVFRRRVTRPGGDGASSSRDVPGR